MSLFLHSLLQGFLHCSKSVRLLCCVERVGFFGS